MIDRSTNSEFYAFENAFVAALDASSSEAIKSALRRMVLNSDNADYSMKLFSDLLESSYRDSDLRENLSLIKR